MGVATIPAQYLMDPTETFPMLLMLGVNSDSGSIAYTDWQIAQDPETKKWQFVDPTGKTDSILLLGVTNQGAPLYVKSDKSFTDDPDDPDITQIAVLDIFYMVSTLTSN